MKKTLLILVFVALVAVGIISTNKKNTTPQQIESITIGAILPLSGDFAPFGESINQGALLAVREAAEQGVDVSYIVEDDHSQATGSVQAANKLINVDRVDAALTATVQEVKPVAKLFNDSRTPLVATWDSNDYIKSAGPSIFTIGFSTEDAGYQMARHAYTNLGITSVAVVTQKDEWSELIGSAFAQKFVELGGTIALSESIQPSESDFRTIIAKMKKAEVGGAYIPFLPTSIAPFVNQADELAFTGTIMTGDSFSQDEIDAANNGAEGVLYTGLFSENLERLTKKYNASYGTEPADPLFVSFGYDGMWTLITAALDAQNQDMTMLESMHTVRLDGVDREIYFGEKQYAEKLEKLYQVVDGESVEIKK